MKFVKLRFQTAFFRSLYKEYTVTRMSPRIYNRKISIRYKLIVQPHVLIGLETININVFWSIAYVFTFDFKINILLVDFVHNSHLFILFSLTV